MAAICGTLNFYKQLSNAKTFVTLERAGSPRNVLKASSFGSKQTAETRGTTQLPEVKAALARQRNS